MGEGGGGWEVWGLLGEEANEKYIYSAVAGGTTDYHTSPL